MGCVGISSNIWSARNGLLETRKNKTFSNEPRDASGGGVEMSTISLYRRHSFEAISKTGKVKTPSLNHDYFVIMVASSISPWNSIDNIANGPSNDYVIQWARNGGYL